MIVPRSFSPPRAELSEKTGPVERSTRAFSKSRSRSPLRRTQPMPDVQVKSVFDSRSEPVRIPSRAPRNAQSISSSRSVSITAKSRASTSQVPGLRRGSVQSILSATTIPTRRKTRGRVSQKLPACDHVADFSRLLLDDIQPAKDGGLPKSHSSSYMDGLFGNIDGLVEGQMVVGSEGVDGSVLSTRSISSESLASLASPDDYSAGTIESHRSSIARSFPERRTPKISPSEDCAGDHPLSQLEEVGDFSLDGSATHSPSPSSPLSRTTSPLQEVKTKPARSTFKSTLTSSLKALKSAARTTFSSSGLGLHGTPTTGFYNNESFLAHNFFDIQPSLTDDRRPPPALTPPSPELRRYLNPQMALGPSDSPTQLHFWQDERYPYTNKRASQTHKDKTKHKSRRKRSPTPKSKIDSLPRIVPLSTCLPPTVRTANASSPPIWLTPDGEPVNKNTSTPLLHELDTVITTGNGMPRSREPRENRDFLRVYVCEMAMRRSGKLSDNLAAGRARLWLPPVPGFQNGQAVVRKTGAERWQAWKPIHVDGTEPDTPE